MQTFKKYLNPLYKELDTIADFSRANIDNDLEKEEYPHLENVVTEKIKVLEKMLPKMDALEKEIENQILVVQTEVNADDKAAAQKHYNQLLQKMQILVRRVNRELIAVDSPYFGKIQYLPKQSRTGRPMNLYIGKIAIVDDKTQIPIVTDWRAPIANLYYQNSGPKEDVTFIAPVGERQGDLLQKRQFQISRARIQHIYDAKSGNAAADEFLLSQLTERIGKKLQDIVSTIQSQQNDIIREEIDKPVLIQGVAGSGKTTIILHRLAYLFFTYKERIRSENSLIIAPNQMFIDYVSDVLPNLGVESVQTETYLFWAKKLMKKDENFIIFNEKENLEIKKYKGSKEFLDILEKYFEEFEEELLMNIPYSNKELIIRRYYELKEQFSDIDMEERLKLALEYAFAQKQFRDRQKGTFMQSKDFDKDKKNEILNYLRRNTNEIKIYREFFKKNIVPKEMQKHTIKGLKKEGKIQHYRMEDLAPLTYLYQKIHRAKEDIKDCVFVDEAQDLSILQIATLSNIAKNGNLTLAGDLAQSIIPPFYIQDWENVIHMIEDRTQKKMSYHQLQRCYRTTVEIIEYSNEIFKNHFPKSYNLPEAVLRHGEKVKTHRLEGNTTENIEKIVEIAKGEFEKEIATCAVICRDRKHTQELYEKLSEYENDLHVNIVNYLDNDYSDGLVVLPVDQAKGLEFDSVIIADVNRDKYPEEELSVRLLYVAVTRALHTLHILTTAQEESLILK